MKRMFKDVFSYTVGILVGEIFNMIPCLGKYIRSSVLTLISKCHYL